VAWDICCPCFACLSRILCEETSELLTFLRRAYIAPFRKRIWQKLSCVNKLPQIL
jgi:hypothetical protein